MLKPLGVQFESSASEAGAAALLGASIHYPVRGAVTWKSIVGTNVAADALSNLASAGLTGGALIIVGEDYGEGASVIQERTHAIALKSSLPLIDPRYDMPKLVEFTERAFDLSEASHLPVILSLRIRAAHMTGSFVCKDNRPSRFHPAYSPLAARYDYLRIPLPPSIYLQEKAKIAERLPAARRFITQHHLNERLAAGSDAHPRIGIVTPGGLHATVARALRRLGLADAFGRSDLEMLVLNVVCPLVPEEIAVFMADMDHVLVVEEGFPPFIEQEIRAIAHSGRLPCNVSGKDALSTPGEFTPEVLRDGISRWLRGVAGAAAAEAVGARQAAIENAAREAREAIVDLAPPRLPGFCTGCPERPIFTALKLLQEETGPLHISLDIGCNTFASLPPFNLGSTVLGYGLSLASGGAAGPATGKSAIAVMGDGGFWHNGFITGAVNAQWNRLDAVLVILENGYAAATGQQSIPSSRARSPRQPSRLSIESSLRAIGVDWIRRIDSYDVQRTLDILRDALNSRGLGLRVVISDQECMLARQRRERPALVRTVSEGGPASRARFGVDEEVCVGDHACMRLSGCPSLTIRPSRDPLKSVPVAYVDETCVACGLCGSAAQAAALCPSFYQAVRRINPGPWNRIKYRLSRGLMDWMGAS